MPAKDAPRTQRILGALAVLLAVSIWSAWIVSTRHAALLRLPATHIGVLRYGIPCILLLPWLWRKGLWPRLEYPWLIPILLLGGAPFFLISAAGMRYAPTAHIGALQVGTMPIFIALLTWVATRKKVHKTVLLGFGFILVGVLAIVGFEVFVAAEHASIGHALALCAAFLWSAYTVAFRFSKLSAMEGTALLSAWSLLIHFVLVWWAKDAHFFATSTTVLIWQGVIQGLGSGLLANLAYGYAVMQLGTVQAGSFLALIPVIASLGGAFFLAEMPSTTEWLGVFLVTGGVLLATGALGPRESMERRTRGV